MPVAWGTRPALLGSGYVLQIKNTSGAVLRIAVKMSDAGGTKSKTFGPLIDPRQTVEISYSNGWPVAPGDHAEITSDGFDPITIKL